MGNEFNFEDGRVFKSGKHVTPEDMADMLVDCVEDKPEEIQGVIVIVKRRTEIGDVFEVGYTTDSVDVHIGRLEIAKEVIKSRFFEGDEEE